MTSIVAAFVAVGPLLATTRAPKLCCKILHTADARLNGNLLAAAPNCGYVYTYSLRNDRAWQPKVVAVTVLTQTLWHSQCT
jgi:hypothetical protein